MHRQNLEESVHGHRRLRHKKRIDKRDCLQTMYLSKPLPLLLTCNHENLPREEAANRLHISPRRRREFQKLCGIASRAGAQLAVDAVDTATETPSRWYPAVVWIRSRLSYGQRRLWTSTSIATQRPRHHDEEAKKGVLKPAPSDISTRAMRRSRTSGWARTYTLEPLGPGIRHFLCVIEP